MDLPPRDLWDSPIAWPADGSGLHRSLLSRRGRGVVTSASQFSSGRCNMGGVDDRTLCPIQTLVVRLYDTPAENKYKAANKGNTDIKIKIETFDSDQKTISLETSTIKDTRTPSWWGSEYRLEGMVNVSSTCVATEAPDCRQSSNHLTNCCTCSAARVARLYL